MDSTKSGRITEPEFVEWWNGKGDSFHKQLHDSLKAPLHAPWPVRYGLLTYDLPRSFASPNRWIQPKCRRSSRAHEHRDGESSARRACSPGSLAGSRPQDAREPLHIQLSHSLPPGFLPRPLRRALSIISEGHTSSLIVRFQRFSTRGQPSPCCASASLPPLLIASLRYRLRCHLHCLRCDVAEALRAGDESQVGAEAGVI